MKGRELDSTFPLKLKDARDALATFAWDFKDKVDSDELDDDCRQYLEDWQDHHGRELSQPEEDYEWESCRRLHFMRKHLTVLAELRQACHQFVQELTKAEGQHLLGQRAMLPQALPSQQPSALTCYSPVKLPAGLSLSYIDYEKDAGGPHVLGARLLWWLAASIIPKTFGYSDDLPLKLASMPIWTTVQPALFTRSLDTIVIEGSASPWPVEAIKDSAGTVCELLASSRSGLHKPAARSSVNPDETALAETKQPQLLHKAELYRKGDLWTVSFKGTTAHLPPLKGLKDICLLLGQPGEEHFVLDMDRRTGKANRSHHSTISATDAAHQDLTVVSGSRDAGDAVDNEGVRDIGRRLLEIDAELEDAQAEGDSLLVGELRQEKDQCRSYLISAGVLGPGKTRKLGDPVEKARKRIRERILLALEKMRDVHPQAAGHLDKWIKFGRNCSYACPSPPEWKTDPLAS